MLGINGIKKTYYKIFGTYSDRELRKLHPLVNQINGFEKKMKSLTDDELKAYTPKFKQMIDNGASLDDLLPESFAVIREVGTRVLNMRHYDVQLQGGIVLHRGIVAEMKTGEGKTLVATLPVYLNALENKGVHVVTVNDYLADRDSDWMGSIYNFMGLSVGKVLSNDRQSENKKAGYMADITYGTNNEFGFDYLRDNMKFSIEDYVQRGHHYAIIDEVDSILIDEARTPLIISGPARSDVERYYVIDGVIPRLQADIDYVVDEKGRNVSLTDRGIDNIENQLGVDNLYEPHNMEVLHHVNQALKSHTLFKRNRDYVVKDGEVMIVDEHTGRLMKGRRWSDGLHQAVEAKEKVKVQSESQTYASITYQNYFRMYRKLSGMTGTAETEAEEFRKIYNLDVLVVDTNKPIVRKDQDDIIYKTYGEKFKAVMSQIEACNEKGQPVLVGTVSVEKSDLVSRLLRQRGIKHEVLNAKNHAREAEIVAQAGRRGSVTVSTNMAGRGTDIKLGGDPDALARAECDPSVDENGFEEAFERHVADCENEKTEVLKAGGLFILGTERHESRRIDNQLRGRAGRQGDPGASRFFLCLEDDLLRIFGSDRLLGWMERMGMKDDEAIEHRFVTAQIEKAQKKS
jgi:preprotein translocase subunit SecA